MDITKELCADNRHRFLHTSWGIRRIALRIFGRALDVDAPQPVSTKDVLEADHVLADFSGRFVPTLADFVAAMAPELDMLEQKFDEIAAPLGDEARRILRSPYAITGRPRALLLTHNSWFLEEILPRLVSRLPTMRGLRPTLIFDGMRFAPWMENGRAFPPSAPRELKAAACRL